MAPDLQPAQRGAVLKLTLGTIAEHPQRAAIEAALPPGFLQSLTDVRPSEWVPVETTASLMRSIHAALGSSAFVALYMRQMERAETDSAFGRFISGVTKLFARTPIARLQHLPRGMDLAQRDCGDMTITPRSETSADVEIRNLPNVFRTPIYGLSMQAPLFYVIRTTGHDGTVECDSSQIRDGILRYHVEWTAAPVREPLSLPDM